MAELKAPKRLEEQVRGLVEKHNLAIDDEASAAALLSSVNYYRLSAYGIGLKKPDNPEHYMDGISLGYIYRLYDFDSRLRNLITPVIEWIEVEFRTRLAYHLALSYGAEGYRNPGNFTDKKTKDGRRIHAYTIQKLDDEIKRQQHLPCVKHHMAKYDGHFPIWAAAELFTFGMACSLYDVCQTSDKKAIAAMYRTKPRFLFSWMLSLSELRNKCAHYNRIYNIPFTKTPALYPSDGAYSGNKLFPLLLAMQHIAGERELWREFIDGLSRLMQDYPEANPAFMGFPADWGQVLRRNAT